MSSTFWQLLCGLITFAAIVAFTTIKVVQLEPAPADSVEYNLLVCVTAEGKQIYNGVVDVKSFNSTYVMIKEDNGLTRVFVNTPCILTRGTEAEFAAATPPPAEEPTDGDGE